MRKAICSTASTAQARISTSSGEPGASSSSRSMRATSSAVYLLVINIVGLGVGPLALGALRDALSRGFGLTEAELTARWRQRLQDLAAQSTDGA